MLTESLMKEVKRIEIRAKRRVESLLGGEYHSAFRGSGIEFAEVRPYEPGDDIRFIDWNVTARSGEPYVKRFHEERQLTVMLVVDTSGSMMFGSGERSKALVAAEAGAILAMAASRNNDRVGLTLFGGERELTLPPAKGRTSTLRIIRELIETEPRGRGESLTESLKTLERVLPRHAIVFVISDFLIDAETQVGSAGEPDWLGPLRRLSRRHEPILVSIEDPRESELPRVGLTEVIDPETGRSHLVDLASRSVRRKIAASAAAARESMQRWSRSAKAELVELSSDRPLGDDLARFFHQRERRR